MVVKYIKFNQRFTYIFSSRISMKYKINVFLKFFYNVSMQQMPKQYFLNDNSLKH